MESIEVFWASHFTMNTDEVVNKSKVFKWYELLNGCNQTFCKFCEVSGRHGVTSCKLGEIKCFHASPNHKEQTYISEKDIRKAKDVIKKKRRKGEEKN